MRCLLSTLALGLVISAVTGCRSQAPTMTNPFLAPDRVPPPATRTLMPGTAQPYYGGAPATNTPVIGSPPPGVPTTPVQQAPSTFVPPPPGTVPPNGWNSTPQPIPGIPTSQNFHPGNIQPAGANLPMAEPSVVRIAPDQQNLRFEGATPSYQSAPVASPASQYLPPDPSILPTPQQPAAGFTAQQASYQSPVAPAVAIQQPAPVADPREVRIRAISSDQLDADGTLRSRDGFRPQGTSQVRKPTLPSRPVANEGDTSPAPSDRFGVGPQYDWLRGQLEYGASTGQWSVRYTSNGGTSDPFGGNLPIANPQVLGALQAGDFVQLRGRVDQQSRTGAAPIYRVSVVQRQRI